MTSGNHTHWIPSFASEDVDLSAYMNIKELNCEVEKMMCSLKDNEEDIELVSRSNYTYNIFSKESLQKFHSRCVAYATELNHTKEHLHNLFESGFCDYLKFPTRSGLPFISTDIYYEYFFGESPWDFTIISKNISLQHEIQSKIIVNICSLKKAEPIINETVLCKLKNLYFRGAITESIDTDKKYKIYDIDRAIYYRIPQENVFVLPQYLDDFPPLTVRSSLVREPMSCGSWTTTLRNYFVEFLRQNRFKIKVFSRAFMEYPPKYIIELIDENGNPLEICKWFTQVILPAIKWTEHKIDLVHTELVDPELCKNIIDEEEDICFNISNEVNELICLLFDKIKAVLEIINRIQHFLQKRKIDPSFLLRFRKHIYLFSSSVRTSNEYIENLYNCNFQQFIHNIRVRLYGDVQPREDVVYKYIEGDNPWDFLIRRIEPTFHLQLTEYYASLLENDQRENIIGFPEFGKIYLCKKTPIIFRGLCIGLTTGMNIKVLNIDMGTFEIISMKDIFDLPLELQNAPPLALRCSLMKNTFGKNKWTSILQDKFKEVLLEKNLSIKIISQIHINIPFKYYVNLTLHNGVDSQSNYTEWFQNFILPLMYVEDTSYVEDKDFDPFASNVYAENNVIVFNGSLPTIEDMIDEFHDYDEVKICKFGTSKQQCWKSECNRAHIGNKGPGFIGSLYTYVDCQGIKELPSIGDVIQIKPVSIVNALTFYAHTIEPEDSLKLTLSLLEKRMNNFAEVQRYSLLESLPCIGELVVVPGCRGANWYRARVIEIDENNIKLFFIDYGYKIWTDYREVRKINFDFLYLPAQAVRCLIFPDPNLRIISNTNELTHNTVVHGVVLSRDNCSCELELVLYKQQMYSEK